MFEIMGKTKHIMSGYLLRKRYGQKYERLDKELNEEAGSAAYEVCACVDK